MVSIRSGSAFLMALFLTACGGSGGKLPLLPPDSSLNYASPPAFTVTIPISPIVPTHNVYLTNFSIIPNLPAGLVLDPATGVISGTPMQIAATTTYTVSVPDGTSAVTATLVITVNPLPAAVSPRPTSRLTSTNAGGADTLDLDIELTSPLVIDLGHTADFEKIVFDGNANRVLSLDTRLRASLWNATTGALIAPLNRTCSPIGPCTVEGALAGPTVVIRQRNGWNTYSSVDGALIAHLDIAPGFATAWTLAIDGSYLLFAGTEGVQAITPQGMTLFTRAGDYLTAAQGSSYFAGPNEVRVANGPAGAQVIENIAVPSGAATTSPAYVGNFAGWFLDGEKFLSTAGNTVRVYSRGAVQLDRASLPSIDGLAGSGEWYWTSKNSTQVYRVGSAGVAAATYANAHAFTKGSSSGNTLALVTPSNAAVAPALSIIDLSGASLVKTDFAGLPLLPIAYAAANVGDWVVGMSGGVLMGELSTPTPLLYSQGAVRSVAGSNTRVAFATLAGKIRIYNAATLAFESEIDWPAAKLALSSDGSILAAFAREDQQYRPDRTLRIYSLPSRNLLHERIAALSDSTPYPDDFQLSASGQVVARKILNPLSFEVTQLDGTPIANIPVNPGTSPADFDTSTGDANWISLAPTQFSGVGALAGDYVWFVSGSTLRVEAR